MTLILITGFLASFKSSILGLGVLIQIARVMLLTMSSQTFLNSAYAAASSGRSISNSPANWPVWIWKNSETGGVTAFSWVRSVGMPF